MWHNLVSGFVALAYYHRVLKGIGGRDLGPQPLSWGLQGQGKYLDALMGTGSSVVGCHGGFQPDSGPDHLFPQLENGECAFVS